MVSIVRDMLKKISKLFLGLVVCASSACVTPTHASSALMDLPSSVIITKIQAAGTAGAKDELIEIFNPLETDVDLSDWCFTNKTSVTFVCFEQQHEEGVTLRPVLPSKGYATIISDSFLAHNTALLSSDVTQVFTPTNQSSGSLVASADTLTLVNANEEVIDTWSWQVPAPAGKNLVRHIEQEEPIIYTKTGTASDWLLSTQGGTIRNTLFWVQAEIITEPTEDTPAATEASLEITELLPNAGGSDTNNEFIEVYNPGETTVTGDKYRLLVGANLDKSYSFPDHFVVEPGAYAVLKNDTVRYSLGNTIGSVQLSFDNVSQGEPVSYVAAPEGESWATIAGEWQYTNLPTPGAANTPSIPAGTIESSPVKVALLQKPCASNQYRSSETGRCRLVATEVVSRTACKDNQTRNVETGRCRNNPAPTAPSSCKAGQERNLETNRCRNITKMAKVGNGLKMNEKTQNTPGAAWYVWVGIGGVVMVILGYAIWEWRDEFRAAFVKIRAMFPNRPK